MTGTPVVLTTIAAIGCGLVAGVFFAFSTFVMKALVHLPPAQGLQAMQSVNRAAPTPWFMAALFGTAAACAALAVSAVSRWGDAGAGSQLLASLLYLVGTVGLTVVYHVPRNNELEALDPETADATDTWVRWADAWTIWNHVRTIAALGAAILLTATLSSA